MQSTRCLNFRTYLKNNFAMDPVTSFYYRMSVSNYFIRHDDIYWDFGQIIFLHHFINLIKNTYHVPNKLKNDACV